MAFDPLKGGGCGVAFEEVCCSFEKWGIFYADPSNVFPEA